MPDPGPHAGIFASFDGLIKSKFIPLEKRSERWSLGLLTGEGCGIIVVASQRAGVAKLADALDSKSSSLHGECGFDSLLRHQFSPGNHLLS